MQITQYITLDMTDGENWQAVHAKQGDDASRFICVTLTASGVVYTPPEGATANFRCLKPDGCSCYNPATINEDGTITVDLTEQVLAVAGRVAADVSLVGTEGQVLSTVSFEIIVERAPVGRSIDSANEAKVLENLIEQAQDKLNDLPWEVTPDGYTDLTGLRQVVGPISVVKTDDSTITMTYPLEGGESIEEVITLGGDGYPSMIAVDGRTCQVTWEGF